MTGTPVASRAALFALCVSIAAVTAFAQSVMPAAASASAPALKLETGSDISISDTMKFQDAEQDMNEQTALAMTTPDYPVTPGDIYTLTYLHSYTSSSLTAVVESDYTVNLAIFGKLNAKGMSFPELKRNVEALVLKSYRDSLPQLTISSVGLHRVMVKGEVTSAALMRAWGLSRLSSVVTSRLTSYSSIRDVEVIHADGTSHRYDLFRASRYGEVANDPYIRPGDTVVLHKLIRKVSIQGEVKRPGTYQLLPGENLSSLIELYGGGYTELADTGRIQITRNVSASDGAQAETIMISADSPRFHSERIVNLDTVSVANKLDRLPLVFFEGAVIPEGGVEDGATSGRIRYRLKDGDTLYTALKSLKDNISPSADLSRAYMTCTDDPTQREVNLEKLLYGYDPALDIALHEGDRFVIPYGRFEVFVTGEVTRSAWVETGSLARLSSVIDPLLTPYSSTRDVEVVSAGGESRTYDLFRAARFGERGQDPYLNPGDTVRIKLLSRKVTIQGEVKRPGTYQLLPGEELHALIERYGGGFTKLAERERIKITRYEPGGEAPATVIYYHFSENGNNGKICDLDVIEVDRAIDYLPFIYFEGAVGKGIGDDADAPESSNRFAYRIASGELLSTIVRNIAENFSTVSDLANAYVVRIGRPDPIPADLETLLYRYDAAKDIVMESADVVIVPFRQYFVTVSGAVIAPGRYPYVPDRSWKYYVNLAGGPDPEKNVGNAMVITDMNDNPKSKSLLIQPEDRIYVKTNDPLYFFSKFAGILSTALSVAALVIGILNK